MTIAILHRGSPAPDDHHLRPLMIYCSPSRLMLVSILVASDDATAGSVIRNAERISPSISGRSHFFLCSLLPYRMNTSMLPVSGAEQLNTSEAQPMWPISSASGAYSRLDSPAPRNSSSSCDDGGMNMFHKPSARAFFFNSSKIGMTFQRAPSAS